MNKFLKIAIWASAITLGIVLLVTQSMWISLFNIYKGLTIFECSSISSIILIILGMGAIIVAIYDAWKNNWIFNKKAIVALIIAMTLFTIGAIVTMIGSFSERIHWSDRRLAGIELGDSYINKMHYLTIPLYPVNVTFVIVCVVSFVGAVLLAAHKHEIHEK